MTIKTNKIDLLRQFILDNPTSWEKTLTQEPFHLSIKRDQGYVLLKYSQIDSNFLLDLVQAARGVIFDEKNNYEVVCRPFEKFFNFGEEQAVKIDWNTASVFEKIDGSILKMWFSKRLDEWIVSTNGVIFGEDVPVMFPSSKIKTFGDMIRQTPSLYWEGSSFDENYTYIFEIVGRENRVVVPYEEIEMYYLTSFCNKSGEEICFGEEEVLFPRPKKYFLNSIEETIEFTKSESFNSFKNEGFVVSDADSNRIKIKTEDYLKVHRLRGQATPNDKRIVEMIFQGETYEFLSYFPEYQEKFEQIKKLLKNYKDDLMKQEQDFFLFLETYTKNHELEELSRKTIAQWAKTQKDPNFIFQVIDGKLIDSWIQNQRVENILKRIEGVNL